MLAATGELFILEDIYFNYEHNYNYTFTFRAKDDFHWSDPKTLYIEIIDKNERPQFVYDSYTLELDEETVSPCFCWISILQFYFAFYTAFSYQCICIQCEKAECV